MRKSKQTRGQTELQKASWKQFWRLGSIAMCEKLLTGILHSMDISGKDYHLRAVDATCYYMTQQAKKEFQDFKKQEKTGRK